MVKNNSAVNSKPVNIRGKWHLRRRAWALKDAYPVELISHISLPIGVVLLFDTMWCLIFAGMVYHRLDNVQPNIM